MLRKNNSSKNFSIAIQTGLVLQRISSKKSLLNQSESENSQIIDKISEKKNKSLINDLTKTPKKKYLMEDDEYMFKSVHLFYLFNNQN